MTVDLSPGFQEPELPAYDLAPLVASWLRSLRARDVSENTEIVYARAGYGLARFLLEYVAPEGELPPPVELEGERGICREHVEAYLRRLLDAGKKASANQQYRSLKTFFAWLVTEEELDRSPMRTMKPPIVEEKEVPVIPEEHLRRLLKVCAGKDYKSRRDTALVMLLLDTGVRLSEVADRQVVDLDLDLMVLRVLGKGRRHRAVPFGRQTATVLDRYLRAYAKHRGRQLEDEDALWWSVKRGSRLTIWGVGTMIENRCVEAGIPHIHPHQFRHTFAHLWKVRGGGEDELMRITGWRSRQMLARYGASSGAERARKAHRGLSPGDRLQG